MRIDAKQSTLMHRILYKLRQTALQVIPQTVHIRCKAYLCTDRCSTCGCMGMRYMTLNISFGGSMQIDANQCESMQINAHECDSMQIHADPSKSMHIHANPCKSMQIQTHHCKSLQIVAKRFKFMQIDKHRCNSM